MGSAARACYAAERETIVTRGIRRSGEKPVGHRLAAGVAGLAVTALAVACASAPPVPTRPVAEVHTSIEICQNAKCRLSGYLELFMGGANLLSKIRDAPTPCGSFAAEGCPAMPWCLSLLQGSYRMDFTERSDVVWAGRDAASVKKITAAAETTPTVDGALSGAVDEEAARLDLASITLSRDAERWREVETMRLTETRRVHDVVAIENCTVVYADACAGRIGTVCTGAPWWLAAETDGFIPVETDLGPPVTRRLVAHGRLVTLD